MVSIVLPLYILQPESPHIEPVAQDGHDADGIGRSHDCVRRNTLGVGYCVVPLRLDRSALEYIPEKDDRTPHGNNGQADVYDPVVDLGIGEP